ncbi:hypothetical protein AU476_05100 [Cupriavidus sp. UYMSc13B]|nr:hypothetical protein AU476_05100 [Cupriavidus sp. UYMSc13B]
MYHLQEENAWWGNYNHNLDSAGVWGIQGPLGPTGALGALGALGPLGISLKAGMTTTADGVYKVGSNIVRQTRPVRYSHDAAVAAVSRTYELFEMYSKLYAQTMGTGCPGCEVNDTSFGVDSSLQRSASEGDAYLFTSNYDQFVSINVVPINALNDYGLELYLSKDGGKNYTLLASSKSNGALKKLFWLGVPYFSLGDGLMDFIVIRVKSGEMFKIRVIEQQLQEESFPGYYCSRPVPAWPRRPTA